MLHPASPFSPELASYVAWLARYHLLLRFEPLEIDGCVEESVESEEVEDDSDADSGFSVIAPESQNDKDHSPCQTSP